MGITHSKVSGVADGGDTTLVRPSDWNAAHVIELDYVEFTSPVNITATSEATANTLVTGGAVTYDGSTAIRVEFFVPGMELPGSAGASLIGCLYDGSSSIGKITFDTTAAGSDRHPEFAVRRLTPSAAAHTYSIRAYVTSGTGVAQVGAGGVGNLMPGYIRITKV